MCGRFTLAIDVEGLVEWFHMDLGDLSYKPRFNVAPTQEVLTYGASRLGAGEYMRWGLIPFFWKQPKPPPSIFNARDDKLASGMWRNSFKRRRCLVLADSFYEWKRSGTAKTPMRIMLKSGEPFGFAALWDEWTNQATGQAVRSCAIVTTHPNEFMSTIHDRMPVILPREAHVEWLAPENQDTDSLRRLLAPFPEELMRAYPVSSLVNSVKNDAPACIAPVPSSFPP